MFSILETFTRKIGEIYMSNKLKKRLISMSMVVVMFICSVITMNYADDTKVYAVSSKIEKALQQELIQERLHIQGI